MSIDTLLDASKVWIKCPDTGETVYTGVLIPPEAFKEQSGGHLKMRCGSCGQEHEWDWAEGFQK